MASTTIRYVTDDDGKTVPVGTEFGKLHRIQSSSNFEADSLDGTYKLTLPRPDIPKYLDVSESGETTWLQRLRKFLGI